METKTTLKNMFVPYYRVSTARQGESGLGLKSQETTVRDIVFKGHEDYLEMPFVEHKSGKFMGNRPILKQAIDYCKKNNKYLVVAKVDRLSRNTEDALMILRELDGRIHSCDIPQQIGEKASKLMVTMYAAFGEHERWLNSERTKLALKESPNKPIRKRPLSARKKKLASLRKSITEREDLMGSDYFWKAHRYIKQCVETRHWDPDKYCRSLKTMNGKTCIFEEISNELTEYEFKLPNKRANKWSPYYVANFYYRYKNAERDLTIELAERPRKAI